MNKSNIIDDFINQVINAKDANTAENLIVTIILAGNYDSELLNYALKYIGK